jgi:hypothetical protein
MASGSWSKYLNVSSGIRRNWEDMDKVMENLNIEIEQVQGKSQAGLIKAAALIRNETEHGAVKTPVDLGNLRASWFTVTANAAIISGGGKSHTPEGANANFVGPKAGEFASSHAAMINEMRGNALKLSQTYDGPFLIMGYSANYALWVHEMIGVKEENWSRKGSNAKWFEAALKKQRDNIVKIIRDNAKIKR